MNRMNQFWPEILAYLKKRNLKLNKDVFVEYLKRNQDFGDENQAVNIPGLNPDKNVDNPGMDMNEEEDETNNNKKRRIGQAEYDPLFEQDQLEGIKAYDIGDMETKPYLSSILSKPDEPYVTDPNFETWVNISKKLSNKSIKKKQYVSYIEIGRAHV